MTIAQLLQNMCAELSEADLSAIRKARGFSLAETTERSSLASFLVSSIGLAGVIASLSPAEVTGLHLLHQSGVVGIDFFERLYGSVPASYWVTYTQQYKQTFADVKKNLVRKGLVAMVDDKAQPDKPQMERWRYALPPEFVPYLPSLFTPVSSPRPGVTHDAELRKKLRQLVGGEGRVANDAFSLDLKEGSLRLGAELFCGANLRAWQMQTWMRTQGVGKPALPASLAATEAILNLLNRLGPGEWATAAALEPAVKIFSYGWPPADVEALLRSGWELGLLARLEVDEQPGYRLAPPDGPETASDLAAAPWLEFRPETGAIRVDLERIPPLQLERLNDLVEFEVVENTLWARPSRLKLGRAVPQVRQSPLALRLAEGLPAFREVLAEVNRRWGQTLLHENLSVARVRDLSLRVQLERELGRDLIVLAQNFVAFPNSALARVEKVLKKSGFVVKRI